MAIKKIRMRPEGINDYNDILHPETSADMVKFADGSTVESHKAEKATQDGYGHIRLKDIPNPEVATKAEAEAGTNNTKMMTPLRVSQAIGGNIRMSGATVEINIDGEWVAFRRIIDVNSWENVQQIVRAGWASDYFQIGDQLISSYDGGAIVWEVIGIDVDTPADSKFSHSMTIQTRDCLHDIQFDAPEPNNPNEDRSKYGNSRYVHSAIKQWLNSNESKFTWKSQHQYDVKPNGSLVLYEGAGFLHRLDPELVNVLGVVNKRVARSTAIDGGGQDIFTDKVFLLSEYEAGLGTSSAGDVTDEFVYPYYEGASNADRTKTLDGYPMYPMSWWLRSPRVTSRYLARYIDTSGAAVSGFAMGTNGLSPACVII